MPAFRAPDGTRLAYRVLGEQGEPVLCLPGGPMLDADYLGDLGGLGQDARLVVLDLRGTGGSAVPADPESYRCDRLVGDVEALADHLRLGNFGLLGHSAGANLALLYAAAYPERVSRMALINPSTWAIGLERTSEQRREITRLRRGEPWFAGAAAAFERLHAGRGTEADMEAVAPFTYGRWDEAAQAHQAAEAARSNPEAARAFGTEGAYDPPATRAAMARFGAPVLLLAGEVDMVDPPSVMAEFAAVFPAARFVVQPGAGHYPWLDDPTAFRAAVGPFLAGTG